VIVLFVVVAAVLTSLGTQFMGKVALRFNIADHPNERRINMQPVPRAGGLLLAARSSFSHHNSRSVRGVAQRDLPIKEPQRYSAER